MQFINYNLSSWDYKDIEDKLANNINLLMQIKASYNLFTKKIPLTVV